MAPLTVFLTAFQFVITRTAAKRAIPNGPKSTLIIIRKNETKPPSKAFTPKKPPSIERNLPNCNLSNILLHQGFFSSSSPFFSPSSVFDRALINSLCFVSLSKSSSRSSDFGSLFEFTIFTRLLVSCRIFSRILTSTDLTSDGLESDVRPDDKLDDDLVIILAPFDADAPKAPATPRYGKAPVELAKAPPIRLAPPARPPIAPPRTLPNISKHH